MKKFHYILFLLPLLAPSTTLEAVEGPPQSTLPSAPPQSTLPVAAVREARSFDGGKTWQPVESAAPVKGATAICADCESKNNMVPAIERTATVTSAYSAAHARALRENKPLIVWVGGNFCERCVKDSANEFVHHIAEDGWDGNRGPATVVAVPHEGKLHYAGVVTRWTTGSQDWGHVPSARRVISEWRQQARSGNTSPLRLLHMSGGDWGMSHNMFWSNYQGGGYNGSGRSMRPTTIIPQQSMMRSAPARGRSVNC